MKRTLVDRIGATMTGDFTSGRVGASSDAKQNTVVTDVLKEFEAQQLAANLPEVYLNGRSWNEAFWRTLIADTMTVTFDSSVQKRLVEAGLTPHGPGVQCSASNDYSKLFQIQSHTYGVFRLAGINESDSWETAQAKIKVAREDQSLRGNFCTFNGATPFFQMN